MKKNRAVIFDLDGVVINSEDVFIDVERKFFAEHGKVYTAEVQQQAMGSSGPVAAAAVQKALGIPWEPHAIMEEMFRRVRNRTHEIRLMQGYHDLMQSIIASGYRRGLGTGAGHDWIHLIFEKFQLQNDFEIIVSSHDVERPKPAPDIFLEVARRLAVAPAQCVVIEDSPNGVAAAKAAGMKCIGLMSPHLDDHSVYADADVMRHTLWEITLRDFEL